MSQFSDPNFAIKIEEKFKEIMSKFKDWGNKDKFKENDMKIIFLDGINLGIITARKIYSNK